ncbi:unnamed protein product, partial [marine sediment metagenome]
MPRLKQVRVGAKPVELLRPLVGEDRIRETYRVTEEMRRRMEG